MSLARRDILRLSLAALLPSATSVSSLAADAYPTRPVTIVVPYSAGGAADLLARAISDALSKRWGKAVVIDNRLGASGQIGTEYVGQAKGDPYKLVLGTQAVFAVLPTLKNRQDFNLDTGFTPITQLIRMPSLLMVPTSLNINSVQELVDYLKAAPGKYAYSSNGVGTSQQLIAAAYFDQLGLQLLHVPYTGSTQALTALAAGDQVTVSVDNIPSALPFIQSGKVKPLAVTTAARVEQFPDLPTLAESGARGFDQSTWMGLMAPAGIPEQTQRFLNSEVLAVLGEKQVLQSLRNLGFIPAGSSPEEFRSFVNSERATFKALLEKLGATQA